MEKGDALEIVIKSMLKEEEKANESNRKIMAT
jgi:hypothetical protein